MVVAESQPQAAFAALAKSVQFEWSYLQRILPNSDEIIQEAMSGKFWPAVFAGTISIQEQHLFSLPARMGWGMGAATQLIQPRSIL